MSMSHSRARKPVRSFLAAALAVAAAPAFAGDTFSQTVFFGDSLTDGGFFRPLLPLTVRPVTGQFTTNPGQVWSQFLADFYGTRADPNGNGQTGTNYAAGGARVGINSTGALGPIPALTTQYLNYVAATGGRADANALYTVWGGANDLFAITSAGAPPTTTITNAVTSEIGLIAQLKGIGARYILVSTVPDLGATPSFRALGPAAQANGTALSQNYNTALFSGLAAQGLSVIPMDTYSLVREIVADPAAYGFTNITGTACQPQITANSLTCNPTSYVTPTAPEDYAFADGVHPTTAGHRILGQYAVSMIEAPRQIGALSHSAGVVGRARAEQVATHLGGRAEGDGMRWWAGVRGDIQRYDDGQVYDAMGPSITGGVDWTHGNLVYGAFASVGKQGGDFGHRGGDFDQTDAGLGGFIGWYGDNVWVNAQLGYSALSLDIDREVQLGDATRRHSGSPDGKNLSFGVSGGYEFKGEALSHGPVVSLLMQRIDIDGYAEDQPTLSTSLAYPDQSFDSMVGSVGWQASYAINDHLKPYVRVTMDHEFEDAAEQAFATSQSIAGSLPYAVPGVQFDTEYATLRLGARTELFGLNADVGLSATTAHGQGSDATVFATFGKGF